MEITFWIKDVFYLENKEKTKRYYVLSDNEIVYDGKERQQLYRAKDPFIISLTECPEIVINYFRVYKKQNLQNLVLMLNGKVYKERVNDYLELWNLTNFRIDDIDIEGIGKKPFLKTTFSPTFELSKFIKEKFVTNLDISLLRAHKNSNKSRFRFTETLVPDFPRRRYTKVLDPPNIHMGQRKLLISEIEFLTKVGAFEESKLILYAGAAPGQHIPLLSQMFPKAKFVLFDPAFKSTEIATSSIIVRSQLFDQEAVDEFVGQNVVLISDIRSTPNYEKHTKQYQAEFEKHVAENIKLQESWVKQLKPEASLLKFRLPFVKGKTEYIKGYFVFQAWEPPQSAETRLYSKSLETVVLDHTVYEEQMFYFNTIYRPSTFFDVDQFFGLNFDILKESLVLRRYLASRKFPQTNEQILNLMYIIDGFLNRRERVVNMILK